MGREIKRVPLTFNWPLNKPWGGFINPFYGQSTKCSACEGRGESPEMKRLSDKWYGYAEFTPEERGSKPWSPNDPFIRENIARKIQRSPEYYGYGEDGITREAIRMCGIWNSQWSHHLNQDDVNALIKAERLWDFTRNPRTPEQVEIVKKKVAGGGNSWLPEGNGYVPSAEEVNRWSLFGMSHDSINQWVVIKAEAKRLKLKSKCSSCKGEGTLWPDKSTKNKYSRWRSSEPPKGKGYQLWETVSEGSPISPVFKTPEELATWLIEADYSWKDLHQGTSYDQWMKFICGPGWAPSFVADSNGVRSGVNAIV
jgi:hypothetical protein